MGIILRIIRRWVMRIVLSVMRVVRVLRWVIVSLIVLVVLMALVVMILATRRHRNLSRIVIAWHLSVVLFFLIMMTVRRVASAFFFP